MKADFSQLDRIPDSIMNTISEAPEETKKPDATAGPEKELFDAGKDAEITNPFPGSGSSDAPKNPGAPGPSPLSDMTAGKLVTGKTAVSVADFIMPILFAFLAKTAGYDFDKKALKLNKDERELLEPAAQDYLNSINLRLTPLGALLVALSVVYGSKFVEILPGLKPLKKAPEKAPERAASSPAADINERLQKQAEKKAAKQAFVKEVLAAGPVAGRLMIADRLKVSKAKAAEIYNNYKAGK